MKQRAGAEAWFASPLKAWIQRFTFVLLVGAAFVLMMVGKADTVIVERARTAFGDVMTPVLDALSRPTAAVVGAADSVRELADIRAENARLREELARLQRWESAARQLDAENQALRQILKLAPDPRLSYVTARVVGDYGGAFVRSVLLAAGTRDGVAKGQAAITGDGLVGRVIEAGERSARLLLLTDINSRVPVLIERTRDRALVAGDNSSMLRLLYLPLDAEPVAGDRVVTSGHGGVYVPGIPVGVITRVVEGTVEVQPFVDWDRLEYVRLLNYEMPGMLLSSPTPLPGPQMP